MMVLLDRGVLPDVITLVLHPKGELRIREEWQITSRTGGTRLSGQSTVVELWTRSAADLLAMNDVGVIPLVPLAETTESPETIVRQCRERIDRQARPEERENLLAVTQVMTRLRYNDPGLLTILGGRQAMIESPLLQEFANERVQNTILSTLRRKFGAVPAEVESRIRGIQDPQRLDDLNFQVAVSPDLDTFQAHLASQ
jgi:predicted transposase YdaD